MTESAGQRKSAIVFVYNADSGLFNALTDIAHKAFSPQTYQCNLCALTHSAFGMRKDWKRFLETLDVPLEFLHADELAGLDGVSGVKLPAIFKRESESLKLWVTADSINTCRTTDDLQRLIHERLADAQEH